MMNSITVLGGRNKQGRPEPVDTLRLERGMIYSVVGFTGSGKSQLISDIEQMAGGDTVTGRRILVDGVPPDHSLSCGPDKKLVAQLSQNMNFTLEMTVEDFLLLHAECRGMDGTPQLVDEILTCTNSLAGEAVCPGDILTRLSGGQSRALMIADVALISRSPVILVDEVENAGIDRRKAMDLLARRGKIVLIVTHDPQLALAGEYRIVMKNGGMDRLVKRTPGEGQVEELLGDYADRIMAAQNRIRRGECLSMEEMAGKGRIE